MVSALAACLFAWSVDVSEFRSIDIAKYIEKAYVIEEEALRRSGIKINPDVLQDAQTYLSINGPKVKQLKLAYDALLFIPLFVSPLFACAWYFFVVRSMKFPFATKIGHQPRLATLFLGGLLALWASLMGSHILETRAFSGIGIPAQNPTGVIFWVPSGVRWLSDRINYAQGSGSLFGDDKALLPIVIVTGLVAAAAVFTILQRKISLVVAFGGLGIIILAFAFIILLASLGIWSSSGDAVVWQILLSWAGLAIACVALFGSRRNLKGISALAVGSLAYLVSFGPLAFILISQEVWTAQPSINLVTAYMVAVAASVVAGEAVLYVVNRTRLLPA